MILFIRYDLLSKKGINVKTYRKVALIFTLLLTAVTNLSAASQSEIDGLVALYNSTDGENWTVNSNWKDGDPCDWMNPWAGVTCVDGSVTTLGLDFNNLTGSIPAEFGNLTNLEGFAMRGNNLTGSIPTTIGSLTNLIIFYLSNNQLTGRIPSEIGRLTSLGVLSLGNNQLSGSIQQKLEI